MQWGYSPMQLALYDVATGGIEVDPVQVMADKLAQKTSGPLQHSNLPKLISKFSHDPTGQELTKDEFTAFMQEGLNTSLGKDEIESLVSQSVKVANVEI